MNYRNAISDFEEYLEDIYSDNNCIGIEYRGYLINLKDYERMKEIIDDNNFNINDSKNKFKINQIEFKKPQYLINMILNGNKYIFINTTLWELICDNDKKNETPIIYKVNSNDISFSLDNIELSFSHNKNIIDEYSLNNSYKYKSKYYDNEAKDENNLKYQNNTPEKRVNFASPPRIGLQNIGATCYMNATLQCFCHIEKFVNFFKYSEQVVSMVKNDKNNLTSSFKLLIEKLWPNNYILFSKKLCSRRI